MSQRPPGGPPSARLRPWPASPSPAAGRPPDPAHSAPSPRVSLGRVAQPSPWCVSPVSQADSGTGGVVPVISLCPRGTCYRAECLRSAFGWAQDLQARAALRPARGGTGDSWAASLGREECRGLQLWAAAEAPEATLNMGCLKSLGCLGRQS